MPHGFLGSYTQGIFGSGTHIGLERGRQCMTDFPASLQLCEFSTIYLLKYFKRI